MRMGGKLFGAAVVVAGLLFVLAWLSPFSAEAPPGSGKGPRGPGGPTAKKHDRDNDRIFDDLEALLAPRSPSAKVEVIVRLREPATKERVDDLERAVGAFATRRRFSLIDAFAAQMTKGQVQ